MVSKKLLDVRSMLVGFAAFLVLFLRDSLSTLTNDLRRKGYTELLSSLKGTNFVALCFFLCRWSVMPKFRHRNGSPVAISAIATSSARGEPTGGIGVPKSRLTTVSRPGTEAPKEWLETVLDLLVNEGEWTCCLCDWVTSSPTTSFFKVLTQHFLAEGVALLYSCQVCVRFLCESLLGFVIVNS